MKNIIDWGLLPGDRKKTYGKKNKDRLCIYDLKTALNSLLRHFNIHNYEWGKGEKVPSFIHPYQYIVLKCNGEEIAYIGFFKSYLC